MIVRRRNWLYRLAGHAFVQSIAFNKAVTAAKVREVLRKTVGDPQEIWAKDRLETGLHHK